MHSLKGQRIFLTGGSGFVGHAVARILLQKGASVTAMVRQENCPPLLQNQKVTLWQGHLGEGTRLAKILSDHDGLFHVAADYRLWAWRHSEIYQSNLDGTRIIMEAALKAQIKRIVYTSSVATLGLDPNRDATEETPVRFEDMIGHYKKSKFLAEEWVRDAIQHKNLPAVIVNPSAPMGAGDIKPTPTGRIIIEAASGRVPIYVDSMLNVVHIDDVARGHALAYEMGRIGERYILGGDNLSLQDIFAHAARSNGKKPPLFAVSPRLLMPLAYGSELLAYGSMGFFKPLLTVTSLRMAQKKMAYSSAKAKQLLNYHSRPAYDAIADSVSWFRTHGLIKPQS